MSEQTYPEFENIKVSTKTYTAYTNVNIDIYKLFNYIKITPYTIIPKKRGRKKKDYEPVIENSVPYGSIITLKCEGSIRGVVLNDRKTNNWFRNALTIVVVLDKIINFKVCKNGTFQMTGCKTKSHAIYCVKMIWELLSQDKSMYNYTIKDDSCNFTAYIIPSMRNIDFDLGFKIDRSNLNKYMISLNKELFCLLETSFGYTGVNIKIPLNKNKDEMIVDKLQIDQEHNCISTNVTYGQFKEWYETNHTEKLKIKRSFNTFLVFHSGKVIFSGLTKEMMKDTYVEFIKIIKKGKKHIIEKLKQDEKD